MKIGILHNVYRHPGGEERVVEAETQLLRRAGHAVTDLLFDSGKQFAGLGPGLRAVRDIAGGWSGDASARVAAWVREEDPDLVHVHNIFPLITGSGIDTLRRFGVPVVMTLHNFRPFCAAGTLTRGGDSCDRCVGDGPCGAIARGCYRESRIQTASWALATTRAARAGVWRDAVDLYIAPSEHVRDTYERAGFPAHKLVVRPHFTDLPPVRSSRDAGAVVVGRVDNSKGILDLIEAWPTGAPTLTVVGSGPDEERARSMAGPNVRFAGRLEGRELAETIASASVLVAPSRLPETFGLTLIEGAACAVPVVAFDAGAASSIIDSGRTGVIVRSGRIEDLVDTAVTLAWSPIRRSAMGLAAAERYEDLYSPEAGLRSLVEIYEQVLSARVGVAA